MAVAWGRSQPVLAKQIVTHTLSPAHSEFPNDAVHVILNCPHTERELGRDLCIREPSGSQVGNLRFPFGEACGR